MSRVYRPRLGWIILYLAFIIMSAFMTGVDLMRSDWKSMIIQLVCTIGIAVVLVANLTECRVRWRAGYMPQASGGMKTIKEEA